MAVLARTQTLDQRTAILGRLLLRNRLVDLLRLAVPAVGLLALVLLAAQIWLAGLAQQYGVSGIRIDRGNLVVETPQYSEIGEDGSRYVVTARDARTPVTDPAAIEMADPKLTFTRPGRSPLHATAATATVDTGAHSVVVPGITTVMSEDGLAGTLHEVRSNMRAQITVAEGPVDVTMPDGSHLTAANMHYDGHTGIWSFERATLVVPNLPRRKVSWSDVFSIFAPLEELAR